MHPHQSLPRARAAASAPLQLRPPALGPVLLLRRRAAAVAIAARAAAPDAAASLSPPPRASFPPLLFEGIAFDMDGTLATAHIPFAEMRERTEIPAGDLFTVMESWEEPSSSASASEEEDNDGSSSSAERVRRAMDVILEIEARAAATTAPMEGLAELLRLLEQRRVRVAMVTRNTPRAVEAFFGRAFDAAGAQDDAERARWRALFDPVITRHDRYVKPDRRLLLDVAERRWGVREMGRVLMVGDSLEDVEIGNACGAASCLIAGGGNEAPGAAPAAPPPGAVPTFSVRSLLELRDLLLASAPRSEEEDHSAATASNPSTIDTSAVRLGWALGDAASAAAAAAAADPRSPGAPAPGLPFFDWCAQLGAFRLASVSFPRIAHAAGGFSRCDDVQDRPDRVLHVGCAEGALTKLLASSGLFCVGADADVSAARRRGLAAFNLSTSSGSPPSSSSSSLSARSLAAGALDAALAARGPFDAVLLLPPGGPLEALSAEAAAEAARVLRPGGSFACEVCSGKCTEGDYADVLTALDEAGMEVVEIGRVAGGGADGGGSGDVVLRVLARRGGGAD
jgi:phosphoglycolate phosphatase-like HAD superfamily hydrolase/SAM-dependent methyltransferase